ISSQHSDLALLFEHDGATFEVHIRTHFLTGFQEANSVFQLEIEVMLAGVTSETNFYDHRLLRIGLDFLLLLLLLVDKLTLVSNPAHWRHSIRRYLHEIKRQLVRNLQCFAGRIYPLLHIITDKTHLRHTNMLVNAVFWFFFSHWWSWTTVSF